MKRVAAIAAFASVVMVGSASAQYYNEYRDVACVMYEDSNYSGRALRMQPDQAVSFRSGQFWNDRVSSIRVARGCSLVVYEDTRMGGRSQEFRRNDRHVGDWNDEISSAECYCDG
ncbi:hypothetical protein G6N74_06940 [Mesorhizobium sp. CGMCC 1.15528]|uniref:Beta/gamma crystallin 'Greek key' domain-containing protein n=1 Tax=Mesorhizobium zhangyense TaxID=1776730 RepID=A0A7C9R639_9HYPH|nr:peptidase inhibitor family I36 protein [Mesorhizobium zhangyense]NGN40796.1 hypothetical protein [Mesorhizobium zhangyense]